MPPLGFAPRLSAPQAEVLLLDYSGRKSPEGCPHLKREATDEDFECASIGTRTRILTLEGLNTTLVLWTQQNGRRESVPALKRRFWAY